jgi:hypothetical protein
VSDQDLSASPADARTLNAEAGNHPVTADPRELAAALRAGERTWARYPYYAARYGERGERFTRSDSGWLATLAEEEPGRAIEQARWLGRVLAARGMPQRLLEVHLATLVEELTAAVPERAARYAVLARASEALAAARAAHVDDARLAALDRAFDARVGAGAAARLPRSGEIVAAAVADDLAGIPRALASVEAWFCDPARFDAAWIEAVRATIEDARRP